MKGEIFNLLESFVCENFGEEQFERIYDAALPLMITKEPFVGPSTYPDSDFLNLVGETIAQLEITLDEGARAFGKYCFPRLGSKIPGYLTQFSHPKDFLLTLHDVIHVEVKKILLNSEPPEFRYEDLGDNTLVMIYRSKRKLYSFAEGLFDGVAEYFQVPIQVVRTVTDPLNGECRFELKFDS